MKALNEIVSQLDFPREYYSIELHLGEDLSIYVCHIKIIKSELHIHASSKFKSIADFFESSESKIPIFLNITGKKILSKKLALVDGQEEQRAIGSAFPSVQQDQLQFQIDRINENEQVISAIRLEIALDFMNQFEEKGFQVLDISIGYYGQWILLSKELEQSIQLGQYFINLETQEVETTNIQYSEINIFGESLYSDFLFGFLNGLHASINQNFRSSLPQLAQKRGDWKYSVLYKKGFPIAISVVFGLLLLNFILFTHYSGKNAELNAHTQYFDQQFSEVESLKKLVTNKKAYLQVNGSKTSRIAIGCDQLTQHVPNELSLQSLQFRPVEKVLKKENLVKFAKNEVLASGETKSYLEFKNWLQKIRSLNWVEDVEILGYNESGKGHQATFIIKLRTSDV